MRDFVNFPVYLSKPTFLGNLGSLHYLYIIWEAHISNTEDKFRLLGEKLKLNWNPWPRAKIEIPRSSIDGDIFSRQLSLSLFLRDTILCLVLCYVFYNRSSLVQDNISFKTTSFYYWPVFWRHRTARLWTASTRTDQPLNWSVSFSKIYTGFVTTYQQSAFKPNGSLLSFFQCSSTQSSRVRNLGTSSNNFFAADSTHTWRI